MPSQQEIDAMLEKIPLRQPSPSSRYNKDTQVIGRVPEGDAIPFRPAAQRSLEDSIPRREVPVEKPIIIRCDDGNYYNKIGPIYRKCKNQKVAQADYENQTNSQPDDQPKVLDSSLYEIVGTSGTLLRPKPT